MRSLFDLPSHPLFVHAPMVLLPVATLLAALRFIIKRAWTGWDAVVAAGLGICLGFTVLAKMSGDSFGEVIAGLAPIKHHEKLGNQTLVLVSVASALGLGTALASRRVTAGASERTTLPILAARLGTLVVAVAASIWMAKAGHEGARLVWTGVLKKTGS